MARIAILNTQVIPGDAVGNDMVAMHRLLAGRGHEVALFAAYAEVTRPAVHPLGELTEFLRSEADVLIYHHSTGWDVGLDLFRRLRGQKVFRYHNITPEHFFAGLNEEYARTCRLGRVQLKDFATIGDRFVSASAYNQRELIALGASPESCYVVPPYHDIERLETVEPDPTVLGDCGDGRTNLLFVGRVAPNKGHTALIEAFAAYHHHYDPVSRLVLVGREDPRLHDYSVRLRALARRLGVAGAVVFTGGASDAVLRAHYQSADVFLSASEHEGFCVPLVEAMALGLPIVAVGSSGVPDTVGPAGLVWPEADPFLLAESVHRVVADGAVGDALRQRGRGRFEERFAAHRIEASFWEAVRGLCA